MRSVYCNHADKRKEPEMLEFNFIEETTDLMLTSLKNAEEEAEKLQRDLQTIIDACKAARQAKNPNLAGPAFNVVSTSMHIGHLAQTATKIEAQLTRTWAIGEVTRLARHPNIEVVKDAE
jgi:hypothetical protein